MKCANALTILSRLIPSRGMIRIVSSPAIVPNISWGACVSISEAIPIAYPGQVAWKFDIGMMLCLLFHWLHKCRIIGQAIYIVPVSVMYFDDFQLLDVAWQGRLGNLESAILQLFKQLFLIPYFLGLYNAADGIQSFFFCTHTCIFMQQGCKYKEYNWIIIQFSLLFLYKPLYSPAFG